jgi:hypothetical protein
LGDSLIYYEEIFKRAIRVETRISKAIYSNLCATVQDIRIGKFKEEIEADEIKYYKQIKKLEGLVKLYNCLFNRENGWIIQNRLIPELLTKINPRYNNIY